MKIGWVPHYLATFRHFSRNFANLENFYKCLHFSRGKKYSFFPKVTQIWSNTRKKIKRKNRGGGEGGQTRDDKCHSELYAKVYQRNKLQILAKKMLQT